jgi:hypothetical protein
MFHHHGASETTLFMVGAKHKVVEDKLLSASEEIRQGLFLPGQGIVEFETFWVVHFDHRHLAAPRGYVLQKVRSRFLLLEELVTLLLPFLSGNNLDWMMLIF